MCGFWGVKRTSVRKHTAGSKEEKKMTVKDS